MNRIRIATPRGLQSASRPHRRGRERQSAGPHQLRGRLARATAARGLTLKEAENVFAKTLVLDGKLDSADVSVVFSEKQQIIRKSGLLEYYEANEEFGQVAGLTNLKEWLTKRTIAFSDRAAKFGLPAPKGVLLLGVQGCGKSLCAKAVSGLWKLPLLRFDLGRMFSSLVGSSEENVRRALQTAESIAPAILWIDEIDKALAGSTSASGSDGGTASRVFGTLLFAVQPAAGGQPSLLHGPRFGR